MVEYKIKSVKTAYVGQAYITSLNLIVEENALDVKLNGINTYAVKKVELNNRTDFCIEIPTRKPIKQIELSLYGLEKQEEKIAVAIKTGISQKMVNTLKKSLHHKDKEDSLMKYILCGSGETAHYSIDELEYLPDYELINVRGWLYAEGESFLCIGKDHTSILGHINYRRQDVSAIYKTDDKVGFEGVYRLNDKAACVEFGFKGKNTEIIFSVEKALITAVADKKEQRTKAEQYYLRAPYSFEEQKKTGVKADNTDVDVLIACNDEKWLINILSQSKSFNNAKVIIVANERYATSFSRIKEEHKSSCELVFDKAEAKEELRYLGLQHTRGRYCLFLEQEDSIDDGFIGNLADMMSEDKLIACADYDLIYNNNHILRVTRGYDSWIKENPRLATVACMIRTDLIKSADNYTQVLERLGQEIRKEAFGYTDNVGYHYNCVEDSWGASEHVNQLAFYLTQYHENEENNKWWGKGFTEWTNVKKGTPMFTGHHQPRVPGELGYYDLVEEKDIFQRQTKLAKEFGIDGFCFYYYWFNGKRLLRKPLDIFLENKDIDFKYCICWANESWTRRWDGLEQEILMEQLHNEDTDEEFIYDIIPMLKDERYIKIDGKPLLLIYRMELFPKPVETVERWKQICRKEGVGEIHISVVQSFTQLFPEDYGADSATEFPPHKVNMSPNICVNEDVKEKVPEFEGNIYSYEITVNNLTNIAMRDYCLMQGSMLEWDNTARRKNKSSIFCDFSPELFRIWSIKNRFYTRLYNYEQGNCTFINAWNEWAEGSYLEPDEKYGNAMLEIIKDVGKLR